jgi:hypothetical protein
MSALKGLHDAEYKTVTFKRVFRWCLGESDPGCTSISYRGTDRNILAHNEEEDPLGYPLCYARVRLRSYRGTA